MWGGQDLEFQASLAPLQVLVSKEIIEAERALSRASHSPLEIRDPSIRLCGIRLQCQAETTSLLIYAVSSKPAWAT